MRVFAGRDALTLALSQGERGPLHNSIAKWWSAPSHRLARWKHDEWLAAVRGELEAIWPAVRQARRLHGRVVAQPAAVFSVQPGVDRFRPPNRYRSRTSPWPAIGRPPAGPLRWRVPSAAGGGQWGRC